MIGAPYLPPGLTACVIITFFTVLAAGMALGTLITRALAPIPLHELL